ncbi:Arc family DNA-binding protein [Agrobacterium radiobacter]|uniref:Arc family DNA-binding protein n=1 Tax=Agrobacterium radiobacter TaxID=362 RepID=UPI000DDA82F4
MKREKSKVKDYDQFQLRLPPGMRDRIKVKAEQAGMSMNEAIVWCLDKHFPAEVTLEEKLHELANLVSMLKDSKDTPAGVDYLIQEVEETLRDLGHGVEPKFAAMVDERLQYWQEMEMDNWRERNESPFLEEPAFQGDGDPFALDDGVPIKDKD